MQSTALAPLRMRPFRRLLVADGMNVVGDWAGEVALALLVFAETGDPLAVALLFLCLQAVPAFATPALVARLEALPTNRALPLIYAIEAAVFLGLGLLSASFLFPAILALAVLEGALALSGRSLLRSSAASLLSPVGQLREGNALLNLVFTGGYALGPALGGLAVAFLGIQEALFIDAATFLAASVLLLATRGLPAGMPQAKRWLAHLREGLAYIKGSLEVRSLLLGHAAFVLFVAAITPIEVVLVKETLGSGDAGYGFFLAAWGAGTAIGGLIFMVRPRRLYLLALAGALAGGLALLGIAASPTLIAACAFSVLAGVGNGVGWVSVTTVLQEATPQEFQARMISVHKALSDSLVPGIAFTVGGALAALTSARATFAIAGAGALLVVLALVPLLVPFAKAEQARARS